MIEKNVAICMLASNGNGFMRFHCRTIGQMREFDDFILLQAPQLLHYAVSIARNEIRNIVCFSDFVLQKKIDRKPKKGSTCIR